MAELTVSGMSVVAGVTLCLAVIHAGVWYRDRKDTADRDASLLAGAMTLVALSAIGLYHAASATSAVLLQSLYGIAVLGWWLVFWRAVAPAPEPRMWKTVGTVGTVVLLAQLLLLRMSDHLMIGLPGGGTVCFVMSTAALASLGLFLIWVGIAVVLVRLAARSTRTVFLAILALTGVMACDCLFRFADPVAGVVIEQAAWLMLGAVTWLVSDRVRKEERANARALELLERAEEDLRSSEAKWRSMAENSPVSMKALTFSGVSCDEKPRWRM